jgi:hypothetical protein
MCPADGMLAAWELKKKGRVMGVSGAWAGGGKGKSKAEAEQQVVKKCQWAGWYRS